MRINLTDNNLKKKDEGIFLRKDIEALFAITGKTVDELCKENERLLVFPYSLGRADDRVGQNTVLTLNNTINPLQVRIHTGNVMGFIGVGDIQVKIRSRFDARRKHNDFFLHYMLQKVLSYNLFDLNFSNDNDDGLDFLMFLFPHFLKNAMRQGIYKEYKTFKHNDANVKGTINLSRHLAHNLPFVGNVAYSTREYTYDNSTTELIRHTIEVMKTSPYGRAILNINRDTIGHVQTIIEHTSSYNKNERSAIISKCMRHTAHPYFTEYRPLQNLCLLILRGEETRYGNSDDEICGILFDGAWLWEEYVNTLLRAEGFHHPKNKKRTGRVAIFEDGSGTCYPDFYKKGIVLDAKYKRLERCDKVAAVGNADLYQLISYTTILKAKEGGFVVPLTISQPKTPRSRVRNSLIKLSVFGILIDQVSTTYAEFCQKMEEGEKEFLNALKERERVTYK